MADPRFQGLERARAAARGADPGGGVDCLSARDARSATLQKRAVSLAEAVRVARDAWDGEVIDYKLCTYDGRLAYELTLLNTNGRVARVRVDASNGKLVGVR
ncbi:PepSY domain-containing protein [Hansschlegelia plantiphila]|nr:PepSY domain-containing protein [Hansschlegelia plantiphila]